MAGLAISPINLELTRATRGSGGSSKTVPISWDVRPLKLVPKLAKLDSWPHLPRPQLTPSTTVTHRRPGHQQRNAPRAFAPRTSPEESPFVETNSE
jgi:hypothetical protein